MIDMNTPNEDYVLLGTKIVCSNHTSTFRLTCVVASLTVLETENMKSLDLSQRFSLVVSTRSGYFGSASSIRTQNTNYCF